MITVGLTGSMGMGKSTVSQFIRSYGIEVWDADAHVHFSYEPNQPGAALVADHFPDTVINGRVDRTLLVSKLITAPDLFRVFETQMITLIIQDFSMIRTLNASNPVADIPLMVADVPLLYEMGHHMLKQMDYVIVVDCPPEIQKQRCMARPGMTEEKFDLLTARQLPNEDKCKLADYIIDTTESLDDVRKRVEAILVELKLKGRR